MTPVLRQQQKIFVFSEFISSVVYQCLFFRELNFSFSARNQYRLRKSCHCRQQPLQLVNGKSDAGEVEQAESESAENIASSQ